MSTDGKADGAFFITDIFGNEVTLDMFKLGHGHGQNCSWVELLTNVLIRLCRIILLANCGRLVEEAEAVLHVTAISQQVLLPSFFCRRCIVPIFGVRLRD